MEVLSSASAAHPDSELLKKELGALKSAEGASRRTEKLLYSRMLADVSKPKPGIYIRVFLVAEGNSHFWMRTTEP